MSIEVMNDLMEEYQTILDKMIDTKNRYVNELNDLLAIDPPTDESDNMIVEYDGYITKQTKIIEQYQSFVNNIDYYVPLLNPDIIDQVDSLNNDKEYGRRIGNVLAKYGMEGLNALNNYYMDNNGNALLLVDYANRVLLRRYL